MTLAFDELAAQLAAGGRPAPQEIEALLATRDLIALGMLADEDRRRRHGPRTTFVRVADFSPEQVESRTGPDVPKAAREIRLRGPVASLDRAVSSVRVLAGVAAGRPVTGFSLADLASLAERSGTGIDRLLRELRDAGLEAVAGLPVDWLGDAERAVRAARDAGLRVPRLTVERLTEGARRSRLERAADLQRRLGGFTVFAPLPVDPGGGDPSTGFDDVREVALARLLVDNVNSIQVDWRVYGPKLAQVALTVGADDLDGVSPVETPELGTRRATLEEVRRNISAASLEGIERDGRFAVIEG
jgi:aminodeoxyfutalosine synthase